MISREELAELTKEGRSADAALADLGEAVHYQILKANCDTGEGELTLQPWLQVDEPDLLASDLCRGWIDALEDLGLTHLSERLDDLTAGSPPMPSDLVLFNVKRRSPPKA